MEKLKKFDDNKFQYYATANKTVIGQEEVEKMLSGVEDGAYWKNMKEIEKENAWRWNKGKTEWSLIDFPSIEPLAKVLMYGKVKYAKDNWKKGWKRQDLVDSLLRHTLALSQGEELDPENGISHVGGVLFNAMALEYCKLNNKFIDDESKV